MLTLPTAALTRPLPTEDDDELAHLLFRQDEVISRRQALGFLSARSIERRVRAGRWRLAHRGIYVTHSGPVTREQLRWIAVLAAGAGRPALLGGVSALETLGMRGFQTDGVHVLVPARMRDKDAPPWVVVHRTARLARADINRMGSPPGTMAARSLVDAAQWARDDDRARAVIAAGFQQQLVGSVDMAGVLERMPRARRRAVIVRAVADAAGGVRSLPEREFRELCRRGGLPEPTRQVRRRDAAGRRRYLDAYFENWGVHVEIDGGQHMDVREWWADMRRQNELWIPGDRVLRFPAWAVRERPAEVLAQVRAALIAAGWRPRPPE
jgi:very-short-patch-repair endonuclease